MKYLLILSLVGLMQCLQPIATHAGGVRTGITVTPLDISRKGDSLSVRLDIHLKGNVVESNHSLSIIPYLEDADGRIFALPPVLVNGKQRQRYYERQLSLTGGAVAEEYYAVIAQKGPLNFTLDYSFVLPYQNWMADAVLNIKEDFCNCGGHERQVYVERLLNKLPAPPPPVVATEVVEVKAPVVYHKTYDVYLQFRVGQADIVDSYGNNRAELQKMEDFIRNMRNDSDIEVQRIYISGYASPEGSAEQNATLSRRRAEALRFYIGHLSLFDGSLYQVEEGGEDWVGLRRRVEASSVSSRAEVLSIIDDAGIATPDAREARLRALDGGRPYRELLNEIYPSLRRVECRVDYTIIEK